MTACGEERCCSMSFLIQSGLRFMGMSSADLCYEGVKEEGLALALCVLLNGTALSNMGKASIWPETQAYLILCCCLTDTKEEAIWLYHKRSNCDLVGIMCTVWIYHHCFGVVFLFKVVLDYQSQCILLTHFNHFSKAILEGNGNSQRDLFQKLSSSLWNSS